MFSKILVPIKPVIDYAVKPKISPNHLTICRRGAKHIINPFDEIALEEAICLKGFLQKTNSSSPEIVVVSVGEDQRSTESLRRSLAIGADRAILMPLHSIFTPKSSENNGKDIVDDDMLIESLSPLLVAKCLAQVVRRESPQLVLVGKQAIDSDHGQTPQLLASLLGWPQALFASKIQFINSNDDKVQDKLKVQREIDGGTEEVLLQLPGVVSVDLRLNVPRVPSLPSIIRAKSKVIEKVQYVGGEDKNGKGSSEESSSSNNNTTTSSVVETVEYGREEVKKSVEFVATAAQLVDRLRDKGLLSSSS